ncbi:hypothetical protein Ahy_A01g003147 [Arachis hypogaea]|uniref:Uncharacterized protein n=1 Tax=Arachis hypogaea TaxID=3818 RepID=A0A445ESK0_ARAHY|nr:hypothetical protein Ahy_A01g003147 [Arachis hypogaea]
MPKQKRYKNLLKAVAAANSLQDKSIAVANSSRDKSAASNASQVKSAAAANSPRDTSSAAAASSSRDKSTAAASSSRDKSTASNSSELSSVAPTISKHPSESKRKHERESKYYWTIDVINEYEVSTHLHLLVKDVHNLPEVLCIVVNFDKHYATIRKAVGLFAGVFGQLATDCVAFPISFKKWSDIPKSFFKNQWNIFFLARFCFKVSDNLAKQFFLQSLGKKWREHRIKLWNDFYDPRLSKTEIINNAPEDIAPNQWALFVEYRLKPETQNLCKRNQKIQQKQIIRHTSGAKSISRRRAELTGKEVSRVQMWDITHKKIDGSYVNEKAKEIAVRLKCNMLFLKATVGTTPIPKPQRRSRCSFPKTTPRASRGELTVDSIAPIQLAGMFPTQHVSQRLDQESEIPSPKEFGSRSSGASNKEA